MDKEIKERTFADLHIHSKYSRACSKNISLESLEKYARIKGLNLLGTGDFQHALWRNGLDVLEERDGLLYSKTGFPFVWQTEISLMYTKDGKGRRIHYVILAPGKEVADLITKFLASKGRLDYDGRPIFGFSSIELVDEMLKIDKGIEIIPAHCMTPWFGIFGSKTGFNSLKECFGEREKEIHAVESGMSADPDMLRKFSFLNNKAVVSFSDSHSFWPFRIGREATIFSKIESYRDLIRQIRGNEIIGTVETDPAYGKYHFDGHRLCNFSCSPEETRNLNGICPKCGKELVIGVENRVEELADQETRRTKPYYKILPLHEVIALAKDSTLVSKKTWQVYNNLIEKFGNEFKILFDVSENELASVLREEEKLFELILENRKGKLRVKPGYDGEYGLPMFGEEQKTLF
ncbi:DNA helicase UvrD [Candidatus Woesearchaeota archaeon CG10_big_fil_rev_8_21_14_0_10_34_12]|nr:MAG: DNA helicase UvrD [Candidatus Woesearchaeota archaeon CG10_big_fil_rev_8_21_14_0_10_34_12]